jgi:hypothetical protein
MKGELIALAIVTVALFITVLILLSERSNNCRTIEEQDEIIREYEGLILKLEEGEEK